MVKIESNYQVPDVDNMMSKLEERRPSNWDVPPFSEQYVDEIGVTNLVRMGSADPTATAGPAPLFEESEHVLEERVEPMKEAALIFMKKTSVSNL